MNTEAEVVETELLPSCRPAPELDNETLVDVLIQSYMRSAQTVSKIQHDRWVECKAEVLKRLTRASTSTDYIRGLEDAAKVADGWAQSRSCSSHDYDPCCHVRTGAGIRDAILALIPNNEAEKGK